MRRSYTIALVYCLFMSFALLSFSRRDKRFFTLPSFDYQISKIQEFGLSVYQAICPKSVAIAGVSHKRLILESSLPKVSFELSAGKEEKQETFSPAPTVAIEELSADEPIVQNHRTPLSIEPPVVVPSPPEINIAAPSPLPVLQPEVKVEPLAAEIFILPLPVPLAPIAASPLVEASIEPSVSLQPATEVPIAPSVDLAARPVGFSTHSSPPQKEEKERTRYPVLKRVILSHNGGYGTNSGIGYGTDYSTVGLFLAPDYANGSLYPLIDLRAHRFDNDTYGFNVGVGGRYIPPPNTFCEILGFNLFYDWRQGFLNEYNQFGIGLEILSKRWDFRANGYFPVGAKTFRYTCVFDNYIGDYMIVNEKQEITTYGFNAEVGWLAISSKNFFLYLAAGPYYLTTNKSACFGFEPIRGGMIRARPQYKDYFAVDVTFSHDSTFNTVWQTIFIVSLPLYQIRGQNEGPCGLTDRQIYQPIERFEVMSLGTRSCWWQNY